MNKTKDEPTRDSLLSRETPDTVIGRRDPEPSMTPSDPVEERMRQMLDKALDHLSAQDNRHQTWWNMCCEAFLAAGVPALLADTQSKDKRIAELEGENERLREALDFYADPMTYFAIGFFPDQPCGEFIEDGEPFDSNMELCDEDAPYARWRPGKRARAALAGTGVASDGGEDG